MVVRNFFTCCVLPDQTPQGQEIVKYCFLGPFALWHLEKSRARAENGKKRNFPVLGVPKSTKNVTTLFRMVVRNFFTFAFWPTRPPRAGNRKMLGV